MARKRFTREERDALTVGTVIEHQTNGAWRPGVVVGTVVRDAHSGVESIDIRDTGKHTRTTFPGYTAPARPTNLRLPQT